MNQAKPNEFLVPFKGRNLSGYFEQNFLWRQDSIYVMDNHRAALWCWLQHLKPDTPHSLFHIDRHYDTLKPDRWLPHLPSSWTMSIDQYLNYSYEDDESDELFFRFDNYLSIYFDQFGRHLKSVQLATHHDGESPDNQNYDDIAPWELPFCILDSEQAPWIMNIDLDYFFCDDSDDGLQPFMSDKYI
jgi:hypothetical protein